MKRKYSLDQVKAIGITNQRETTVAWRKDNGLPLCNAIVWHDARTKGIVDDIIQKHPNKGQDVIKHECGLPVSTYFSASKVSTTVQWVGVRSSTIIAQVLLTL